MKDWLKDVIYALPGVYSSIKQEEGELMKNPEGEDWKQ